MGKVVDLYSPATRRAMMALAEWERLKIVHGGNLEAATEAHKLYCSRLRGAYEGDSCSGATDSTSSL